jgi:hypothetical protein
MRSRIALPLLRHRLVGTLRRYEARIPAPVAIETEPTADDVRRVEELIVERGWDDLRVAPSS